MLVRALFPLARTCVLHATFGIELARCPVAVPRCSNHVLAQVEGSACCGARVLGHVRAQDGKELWLAVSVAR